MILNFPKTTPGGTRLSLEERKKVGKFENDPKIYIRMIHTTNSSIFVRKEKSTIQEYGSMNNYQEFEASDNEKAYVNHVVEKYFV